MIHSMVYVSLKKQHNSSQDFKKFKNLMRLFMDFVQFANWQRPREREKRQKNGKFLLWDVVQLVSLREAYKGRDVDF